LRGELPDAVARSIDAHVDGCEDCRLVLSSCAARKAPVDPFSDTLLAKSAGDPGSSSDAPTVIEPQPGSDPLSQRWLPGEVIAHRFVIQHKAGVGGMGAVYRARDGATDEDVAIKVVRHLGSREVARFAREVRVLAALEHSAIVRYVTHGTDLDGAPFLVMEWLEGEDLAERLLRGRLEVQQAARLALRIAEALSKTHAAGVLHRDIKPSNIFLTNGEVERAVILDFGLARAPRSEGPSASTRSGAFLGTLGYVAPEQARGAKTADGRADIFSLGSVFFECLTGRRAFPGGDPVEVLAKLLVDPVVAPSALAREVPPPLDEICAQMLAKDPADRPQDCAEVAARLRAWLDRSNQATSEASATRPSWVRWVRARRRAAPIAAVAALVTIVGGAAAVRGRRSQRPDPVDAAGTASPGSTEVPAPMSTAALVLGFENQTVDPMLDGTLDLVFVLSLSRSTLMLEGIQGSDLRSLASEFEPGRVDDRLGQRLAARDGGAVLLIHGSVAARRGGYALAMRVTDPTGALVLSSERDAADASRVVPTAALFASDLRTKLGETPPIDPGIAERTSASASLEADHELLLAWGLFDAAKTADGIAHARRAVALDPTFAKAYGFLGMQLKNVGKTNEAFAQYQLALKWSDSLSEKERLRLVGDYEWDFGDLGRSIDAYEKRLALCPRDWGTMGNLAGAYMTKGDAPRSSAIGAQVLAHHPHDVTARSNHVLDQVLTGDLERAVDDAHVIIEEFPRPPSLTYLSLAVAEALLDHPDAAKEAYAKLAGVNASLATFGLADLEAAAGRLSETVAVLEKGIAADVANGEKAYAAVKWAALAEARLGQGEKAAALDAAEKAIAAGDAQTLYMAGTVLLDTRDSRQVRRVSEIVSRLGRGVTRDERYYAALLGADVLVAQGNAQQALAVLDGAARLGPSWLVRYRRGLAYAELHSVDRAEEEWKACLVRRSEGALVFDDAPSVRYLSRITQARARASIAHDP
jgi:tetratricopeptide (TPR) repeat protein